MLKLREDIERLELATRSLEPSLAERQRWQETTNNQINHFIEQLPSLAAYQDHSASALTKILEDLESTNDPTAIIAQVTAGLSSLGIVTAGPGHLGFVPGGGLYAGSIADQLAAALNVFSADSFASPVAVAIHQQCLRWLCSMVHYPDEAWGDITSGGSHATLTALQVARHSRKIKAADYHRTCVYLSEQTHHCCAKALHILFGEEVAIRKVPLKDYRMDAESLAQMIQSDRESGLLPSIVVATAGSTNLGCIDPLSKIAAIAAQEDLWLHVDAACGGFFALCDERKEQFAAMAAADSVVLDPHKGMFLPYGCGAVLIKDGELLRRALAGSGGYLQDRKASDLPSPMDYSMELSRPFRSLRIWLALRLHGEDLIRQALEEKLRLAEYCRTQLLAFEGIEMIGPMDLSILAFHFTPSQGADHSKAATQRLLKLINLSQDVFLSSTTIDGHFVIRVAIVSFRTHLKTIDKLLAVIASALPQICQELSSEGVK